MLQKFTVSRDDGIYEAWPDLVLTVGGRLICVFPVPDAPRMTRMSQFRL